MKENRHNPFFTKWDTPHGCVDFNAIRQDDYEEAFIEGIRRDNERINKITENKEKPTFDNTILDDEEDNEEYYGLLDRVSTVFFNLLSAETNDEMDALANKIQPMLTKHANDVRLNKKLFERVRHVHRYHRILSNEEKCLLNNSYDGFTRSGALLNDSEKEKLRMLSDEASRLSLLFSQNLLKEKNDFFMHLTEKDEIDGLPETALEAAKLTAKERGLHGWVITLDAPSYGPFMSYSRRRDLRQKLFMAYNTLCCKNNSTNNIEICKKLVNLRRETAELLGFNNYADYILKKRMAGSTKKVYNFLNDLIWAYRPTAEREMATLERFAKRQEGKKFKLEPWDIAYYSQELKKKKYDIDSEMLRPYFELSKVIQGVFGLANKLYGISFKENKEIPVYHPDVKAYEVTDHDGSYLAVFYADFHPRKGKQGGAWMTEYQGQYINKKGENIRPHVSVVMNLTKPTNDNPALLTLGEVETFLHEFGHALHGMLANTRFESMSGTNVLWDFVELPSQFMENYAVEKEFLRTFAFHYKTGDPMPDELIDKIVKSRNFMSAYACMRQISFGLLDMAYYTLRKPIEGNLRQFEKKAWQKATIIQQPEETCMTTQFSHIMAGGYAAGYYSYKWAEVLDADAFSVFKKKGIFNTEVAQRFRDCILSKGGTEHPMTLYRRFKGSEPSIKALLKRNGIK